MSQTVFIVAVAAVLLLVGVNGKGSFGYTRSSGGGYVRSSKSGFYSRTNRFYVGPMYWRSGYVYSGSNNRISSTRAAAAPPAGDDLADVLCKRRVEVDTGRTDYKLALAFNSSRTCFKELYAQPGHPGNPEFNSIMLDRYQVAYSVASFPHVQMSVYPDIEINELLLEVGLRFKRLVVLRDNSPTLNQNPSIANLAEQESVSLDTLTWTKTTLGPQPSTVFTSGEIGRLESRFLDGGRVYIAAVTTTWNNLAITLRFWLSDDFDEDPAYDHVLLLPNAVKIDLEIKATNEVAFKAAHPYKAYFGLEGLLAAPHTGAGSSLTPVPVVQAKMAYQYNPREMGRIEIGSTTDQTNYKAGYLSWFSASNREFLCFDATLDPSCVVAKDTVKNTLAASNICVGTPSSPECTGFVKSTQQVFLLTWYFMEAIDNTAPADAPWRGINWYLDLGYWDPAQGTQPDLAGSTLAVSLIALIALAVLTVV